MRDDPMIHQWLVFLAMAAAFSLGAWFVIPWKSPRPARTLPRIPLRRSEEGCGARFIPAAAYAAYRNPMRLLRRMWGWPSGRQWVKQRKFYNREHPNGARRLAEAMFAFVYRPQQTEAHRA